ncbi:MAG: fibronectin type III domain-containing protein [Legionella sp.]|nr:fibronectin type III domain-containing protein [Legionella sp.]
MKMIRVWSLPFLLGTCVVHAKTGLLFNITESGNPVSTDIILCLNAKGPASCQRYHVSAQNLSIRTTINRTYPSAGIKVLTGGFAATGCTSYSNGYCLFEASQTSGPSLSISPGDSAQKKSQALAFSSTLPSTSPYNSTFTVQATASSGLPVTYASSGVCTNNGAAYTMTSGTGSCGIIISQGGNDEYNAASNLSGSVTASLAPQSPPLSISSSTTTITVGGTANLSTSGGAGTGIVSYVLESDSTGCTLNGATVLGTAVGTCKVGARKAADSNYQANFSSPVSITVNSAATVPGSPTGVTAVKNNGQAPISWTAPTNTGGSPITGYTATASDNVHTCDSSGPTPSCLITGLTNGTPYTYTVVAKNNVGNSAPSAASSPVTPTFIEALVNLNSTNGFPGPNPSAAIGSFTEGPGQMLYGVIPQGGSFGGGTLFRLSLADHSFTVLAEFDSTNTGSAPFGKLLYASDGNLYGTTSAGGANGYGIFFKYTLGDPSPALIPIFEFEPSQLGTSPYGGVIEDLVNEAGVLYGATRFAGSNGNGMIYKYTIASNTTTTLGGFDPATTGTTPTNNLLRVGGVLYGATFTNGTPNAGAVFNNPISSTTMNLTAALGGALGIGGTGGLMLASDNYMYGVTFGGGSGGAGAIYKVQPGSSSITLVADLNVTVGGNSFATLIQNSSNGFLYGTAAAGGDNGNGTIFRVDPAGSTVNRIYSFPSSPTSIGFIPWGGLTLANGNMYGITTAGGANTLGTIFVVYPPFT